MRNRLAIRFTVEGDLRFISHHDALRLFKRALVRAEIPLRFSQGFNPQPKLRIALPRPVGVASLDELLLVELASQHTPSDLLERLAAQMPSGMTIKSAEPVVDSDRCLPFEARYSVEIASDLCGALSNRIAEFLATDSLVVERSAPKLRRTKSIDVRQYVGTARLTGNCLTWSQTITPEGTARAAEVLEALGLTGSEYLHRLVRTSVSYQP